MHTVAQHVICDKSQRHSRDERQADAHLDRRTGRTGGVSTYRGREWGRGRGGGTGSAIGSGQAPCDAMPAATLPTQLYLHGSRIANLPVPTGRASLGADHGHHRGAAGNYHGQRLARRPDACVAEEAEIQDEHSEPRDHEDQVAESHRHTP
jgi:hypothetical protein